MDFSNHRKMGIFLSPFYGKRGRKSPFKQAGICVMQKCLYIGIGKVKHIVSRVNLNYGAYTLSLAQKGNPAERSGAH